VIPATGEYAAQNVAIAFERLARRPTVQGGGA
jgi:hypothetical protein